MPEQTKTAADKKLIKDIFGFVPLDFKRYPDGKLSVISPDGKKFVYSNDQLINIMEAVRQERAGRKKLQTKKSKELEASAGAFPSE